MNTTFLGIQTLSHIPRIKSFRDHSVAEFVIHYLIITVKCSNLVTCTSFIFSACVDGALRGGGGRQVEEVRLPQRVGPRVQEGRVDDLLRQNRIRQDDLHVRVLARSLRTGITFQTSLFWEAEC